LREAKKCRGLEGACYRWSILAILLGIGPFKVALIRQWRHLISISDPVILDSSCSLVSLIL
jgi:hypothetical protein